jgi:hypothetical protein
MPSPVLVSVALIGVKGCKLVSRRVVYMGDWHVAESVLHPYCDSIWNAAGFLRLEHFNTDGKWQGYVGRG